MIEKKKEVDTGAIVSAAEHKRLTEVDGKLNNASFRHQPQAPQIISTT